MTDIFNLSCLLGTMLQPVFATDTDSWINIGVRNMDVTTSNHIMKLQHVGTYNAEVKAVDGGKDLS
jgi:hypothetical protein